VDGLLLMYLWLVEIYKIDHVTNCRDNCLLCELKMWHPTKKKLKREGTTIKIGNSFDQNHLRSREKY
jgi:hypothetical protein